MATERATRAQDKRKLSQLFDEGKHMLEGVYLAHNCVCTNIAMFRDAGAKEPWIIATSLSATPATARRYAKHWGIEAMFPDFKSRGFGIEDSQLRLADRIDWLVMNMAIALYWAVSTGIREVTQSDT